MLIYDRTAPTASLVNSLTPLAGNIVVQLNDNLSRTFKETDGSDFTDASVDDNVTLTDSNNAPVPFDATVNPSAGRITINPTEDLVEGGYVVTVNNFEDAAGNEQTTAQTLTVTADNRGVQQTVTDMVVALARNEMDGVATALASRFGPGRAATTTGTSDTDAGALALWGSGDFRSFAGGRSGANYEGDLQAFYLGADARIRPSVLLGLMLAYNDAELDFDAGGGAETLGTLETSRLDVFPYLYWTPSADAQAWLTAGAGKGEAQFARGSAAMVETDLSAWTALGGFNWQFASVRRLDLSLRGDMGFARYTTGDAGGDAGAAASLIHDLEVDAVRARMGFDVAYHVPLARAGALMPYAQFGVRHDGGDGETGRRLEFGGGVRYASAGGRVGLEAWGRSLRAHSADSGYKESGYGLMARVSSRADGQGLSLMVVPRWGAGASGGFGAAGGLGGGNAGAAGFGAGGFGGGSGFGASGASGFGGGAGGFGMSGGAGGFSSGDFGSGNAGSASAGNNYGASDGFGASGSNPFGSDLALPASAMGNWGDFGDTGDGIGISNNWGINARLAYGIGDIGISQWQGMLRPYTTWQLSADGKERLAAGIAWNNIATTPNALRLHLSIEAQSERDGDDNGISINNGIGNINDSTNSNANRQGKHNTGIKALMRLRF